MGAVDEAGLAALGRPREGEGVALGRPKDGEGNLESETAEGKLLMCSLFTGEEKKMVETRGQFYKIQRWKSVQKCCNFVNVDYNQGKMQQSNTVTVSATTGSQESPMYPPDRPWLGEKAALWLLCGNRCRNGQRC